MDEPTASLSAHEVERLLNIGKALKARGVAVLYISHRLDEIFRIADRVTVLRDGKHISTKPIAEVNHDGMVKDMVGRALDKFATKTKANEHGPLLLSVKDLSLDGVFRNVTFDLHKGEVLCFAGLVGSRRTDVGLALFGISPSTGGSCPPTTAMTVLPRTANGLPSPSPLQTDGS
jgi:rhamnose transport system ATP-binding protein